MEIVKCCKTLATFCKYKHIIIHVKNHFIFPPGHILQQNQTVCMVRHHSLEKKQNKKKSKHPYQILPSSLPGSKTWAFWHIVPNMILWSSFKRPSLWQLGYQKPSWASWLHQGHSREWDVHQHVCIHRVYIAAWPEQICWNQRVNLHTPNPQHLPPRPQ